MSTSTHSGRSILATALLSLAALSLNACITVPLVPPSPMDTKVGLIPVKEKILLKVAIFTNPSHREIYRTISYSTFPNAHFPATAPQPFFKLRETGPSDEERYPVARELAKACQAAFGQIFESATVVSDLTATYEGYDVVIFPKVIVYDNEYQTNSQSRADRQVDSEGYLLTNESNWREIILDWKLQVFDRATWKYMNLERLKFLEDKQYIIPLGWTMGDSTASLRPVYTHKKGPGMGGGNYTELPKDGIEIGAVTSESISILVTDWATRLLNSKLLHEYAAQLKKSP